MKKSLSRCEECGEENAILTQVSNTVDLAFLCSDCYSFKYSKEIQNEFCYAEKEKN
tara:strand:- start:724 stop:891 length:168 start_codon:yes stop_codon:yes gene_type:complete